MSKPIVVPTTISNNLYKKVTPASIVDTDDIVDDEIDDDVQKILEEKPKRRGRPRKTPISIDDNIEEIKPKRRGRPRKNTIIEDLENEYEDDTKQPVYQNELNNDIDEENTLFDDILPGIEDDILPGIEEDNNTKDIDEDNINTSSIDDNLNVGESVDNEIDEINEDEFDLDNSSLDDNDDYIDDNKDSEATNDFDTNVFENNQTLNNLDNKYMKTYDNIFDDEEFEGLLSKEKKVVSFVGASKNGTSFLINNVALILSNMGIDTAILDATTNKNSFYIYTKNDDDLRKIASNSFDNLINETTEGIKVNNNLTVYTTIPSKGELINSSRPILETLIRNHSLVLIDCDFNTPIEYFDKSLEIYLVQSMDILTIQPLTEFLRELKIKNILNESKLRIILNKTLSLKGVNSKKIVGGMSKYNDPEMSFMTDLFNANTIKVSAQIPFDEDVYIKYLNSIIECDIQINGYPKEFKQRLKLLAESIYPLLPADKTDKKDKKKRNKEKDNLFNNSFSPGMNSTLDNMRKKY